MPAAIFVPGRMIMTAATARKVEELVAYTMQGTSYWIMMATLREACEGD